MSTAILEPPASASALRLPSGWSRWQWLCVLLAGLAFALLVTWRSYREEIEVAQTGVAVVFARAPADGAADRLEGTLVYQGSNRQPQKTLAKAAPAGSAGQLRQYEFRLVLRDLKQISLRAPGKIEIVRLYAPDGEPIARLDASQFRAGPPAAGTLQVQLCASSDDPAAFASLEWARLPISPVPNPWHYFAVWGFFYTAVWLVVAGLIERGLAKRRLRAARVRDLLK